MLKSTAESLSSSCSVWSVVYCLCVFDLGLYVFWLAGHLLKTRRLLEAVVYSRPDVYYKFHGNFEKKTLKLSLQSVWLYVSCPLNFCLRYDKLFIAVVAAAAADSDSCPVDGSGQSFGGLTAQIGWFGLRVGGHPALSMHSSNEPGELSQWLCHDDSTVNIVSNIIIIFYTLGRKDPEG